MTKLPSRILAIILFISVTTLDFLPVEGGNILAITPIGAKSHWNFMKGILRALTDHGHYVTVFTPYPEGNRENYTEIDLSKEIEPNEQLDFNLVQQMVGETSGFMEFVHSSSRNYCKIIYKNNALQNIVGDSKTKYDIIFMELRASECMSFLSAKLNLPLVYVTPPPLISYIEFSVLGHYPNPAVVSHTLAHHSVPRTFFERFTNTILSVYTSFLLQYKSWTVSNADTQAFDLVEPIKPSIVFSNAHFITDASRPIPTNVIQVGGIHLCPPQKIPEVST